MPGTTASWNATPAYPNARAATGGLKPGVVRTSPSARSNHAVGTSASYAEAPGHATAEAGALRVAPIANKPTADAAARPSSALLLRPAVSTASASALLVNEN